MHALRRWSVRHARGWRRAYALFERCAPALAPLARLIGARRAESLLRPIERSAKSMLFDCRMCGQCVLSSTGMACPMNCPKQLRNGPCGGVRSDGGCEVEPAMRCVWLEAIDGARAMAGGDAARLEAGMPALAPLDHRRRGRSAWLAVVTGEGGAAAIAAEVDPAEAIAAEASPAEAGPGGARCESARGEPQAAQPGSAVRDAQGEIGPFEAACRAGRFVVTVEVAPPDSADPAALVARAARFEGLVDAINITDGAGGNCHMSSVAASAILAAHGLTPVYQIACRDRNRIAIQGDLLGAAALGVRNILCLTGDDVSQGDHPEAKAVFDLDAVSLLRVARGMCERGQYASGRKLERAPRLFIGATANPFVPPYAERVLNLRKKIDAGARFIQTQFCFDVRLLEDFMREVRAQGLHRRASILVGVGTLGSAKALRWMARHVPGIHVPEALLARIARAGDQKAEAARACVETIREIAGIEGVAGVHVMGHRNEDVLAGIIVESGLRQRAGLRTA